MNKDFQVTEFAHPDLQMPTQFGNICYCAWIHREIGRWMDKDFRRAYIRMSDDGSGNIAMFTDSPDMVEVGPEDAA